MAKAAGNPFNPKTDMPSLAGKVILVTGANNGLGKQSVIEYARQINPRVKIIASAGSAKKVEIMRSCGADVAFNYKEERTFDVLKREGPIDVYAGRRAICGFS